VQRPVQAGDQTTRDQEHGEQHCFTHNKPSRCRETAATVSARATTVRRTGALSRALGLRQGRGFRMPGAASGREGIGFHLVGEGDTGRGRRGGIVAFRPASHNDPARRVLDRLNIFSSISGRGWDRAAAARVQGFSGSHKVFVVDFAFLIKIHEYFHTACYTMSQVSRSCRFADRCSTFNNPMYCQGDTPRDLWVVVPVSPGGRPTIPSHPLSRHTFLMRA